MNRKKRRSTFIAVERRTIRDYAKMIAAMYEASRYWRQGELLENETDPWSPPQGFAS